MLSALDILELAENRLARSVQVKAEGDRQLSPFTEFQCYRHTLTEKYTRRQTTILKVFSI